MNAVAVIFDMDGVLVDSGAGHRAAWRALLEERGIALPAEFWRRTIGRPAEEAVGRLLGRTLSAREARELSRRKNDHFVRLTRTGLPAVPGVVEFVVDLVQRQVPLAVATSARRADAERLLSDLGLLPHFPVVIAAEDVRRGKPDPEVYLLAAQGLGASPAQCLVFEDSLVGVAAARSAGMRVVGVATAHAEPELLEAGAERVILNFEACRWPL